MPSEHLTYAEEQLFVHDALNGLPGDVTCSHKTTCLFYAAFHYIHELCFTKHGVILTTRHVEMMKEIDAKRSECLVRLPKAVYEAFREMKNASERCRYGSELQFGSTRTALLKADYLETARNFVIMLHLARVGP